MLVTAKHFKDKTTTYLVENDEAVIGLLEFMELPVETIYATVEGRTIDLHRTFAQNGIVEGSNINILGRMRGGAKK